MEYRRFVPPRSISAPNARQRSWHTVLPRTDKYKAKNFNDTFVYRLGDQLGVWSYTAIAPVGLGLSGLALTMMPLAAVWLLLGVARRPVTFGSAAPPSPKLRRSIP